MAIIAIMRRASITEVKNNLSALIDSVQGGDPILIVDRGRPVARLEAVQDRSSIDGGRLERLVRAGIVRPGRGRLSESLMTSLPPQVDTGASLVRAIIEERREGR
jgi:prevent-host-death family protein